MITMKYDTASAGVAVSDGVVRVIIRDGQTSPFGQKDFAQLGTTKDGVLSIPEARRMFNQIVLTVLSRDVSRQGAKSLTQDQRFARELRKFGQNLSAISKRYLKGK